MFKSNKVPTELPENATYGDAYHPLEYIEDREEASRYFQILVNHLVKHKGKSEGEAREIVLHNIGYWSGYHDSETAKKILDLFDTTHPIFGRSHAEETLSPEDAFRAGVEWGEKNNGE